jgi:hypothetical protein
VSIIVIHDTYLGEDGVVCRTGGAAAHEALEDGAADWLLGDGPVLGVDL